MTDSFSDDASYCIYWIHLANHCLESNGYVGVAKNAEERWYRHKKQAEYNAKYPVHRAINKHKGNLMWTIIATGTKEECYEMEQFLRPSEKIGWNIKAGGINASSFRKKGDYCHSNETRIKMSMSHRGKKLSDEHKKNIGISQKGKVVSNETRNKMSVSFTGRERSDNAERFNKKVLCVESGIIFNSIKEAAEYVGCSASCITNAINKRNSIAKGLTWKKL